MLIRLNASPSSRDGSFHAVNNFKLREHRDEVPQLLGVRVLLLQPHGVENPSRLVGKPELAEVLQLLRVGIVLHRQDVRLELLFVTDEPSPSSSINRTS